MARILLVEDDVSIAGVFSKWLASEGHAVEHVTDGWKGIEVLDPAAPPDLVVSDLMMPDVDGTDFAQAVAAVSDDLPMLVVTACTDASRLASMEHVENVRAVLHKPVTMGDLLRAVENALSGEAPPPDENRSG